MSIKTIQFHDNIPQPPPRDLIKGLLPEVGVALLSGQWGTYKTTIAVEMTVAVMSAIMSNERFAGKYLVKNPGSALFYVPEAPGLIRSKLQFAIEMSKSRFPADWKNQPWPFAFNGECPVLTNPITEMQPINEINDTNESFKSKNMPRITFIPIDTLSTAARYIGDQENEAAINTQVFSTLEKVAIATRGSSAKEAKADAILSILAERELNGNTKNHRLAVRKKRDGLQGFEIPFTPKVIETGKDGDGDPITQVQIEWGRETPANVADELFMVLLKQFNEQGRNVSSNPGRTYAPTLFAEHQDANGVTSKGFKQAMERLLLHKRIRNDKYGNPSELHSRLIINS